MNSFNESTLTSTQNLTITFQMLKKFFDSYDEYANRSIGGIGFVINFIFLFIFSKNAFNGRYNYQWCHTICNIAVCIIASIRVQLLSQKEDSTFYYLIYSVYVSFLVRIFLIASVLSDILLIFSRFALLSNKKYFLSELSRMANLGFSFGVGISAILPFYIASKIVKSEKEGIYFWEVNEFGKSQFFLIYLLALFFFETVIPLTFLTILNILSIRQYQTIVSRRRRIIRACLKIEKAELRFTKTVLTLNIIWVISRILDMIIGILNRMVLTEIISLDSELKIVYDFLRDFIFSILYIVHAFEPLVYMIVDKQIRNVVVKILRLNKVRNIMII